MNIKEWQFRYQKATFIICLALIIWGIIGAFFSTFNVTLYWGVGLGVFFLMLFIIGPMTREFGIKKGLLGILLIIIIIFIFLTLNQYRGWPFGLRTFHDILGWKMSWSISWPIPFFWSFIVAASLLVNKPKEQTQDPKKLFSWGFDSAISVFAISFIVEPILANTHAITWSVPGAVLGVPFSSFLGWFITSFVACFAFIFLLKPKTEESKTSLNQILIILLSLSLLSFAMADLVRLSLIKIFAIIIAVFVSILLYLNRKKTTKSIV